MVTEHVTLHDICLQAIILTSLRGWNTDWEITWDGIQISVSCTLSFSIPSDVNSCLFHAETGIEVELISSPAAAELRLYNNLLLHIKWRQNGIHKMESSDWLSCVRSCYKLLYKVVYVCFAWQPLCCNHYRFLGTTLFGGSIMFLLISLHLICSVLFCETLLRKWNNLFFLKAMIPVKPWFAVNI